MGDSPFRIILNIFRDRSVARIRGLENLWCFVPGAYAPGFMLSPAPQAEADFLCKAGETSIFDEVILRH